MAIVRRGGAISSPGTLRGNAKSLESLMESDEEKMWVRARALVRANAIWGHLGARK